MRRADRSAKIFGMQGIIRLLCALLLAFAFLTAAEAAKKKKEPPKPRGTVIATVTPESITITENATTKTFAITRFTEILVKGQRATLADLQPGMAVSVTLASDPTKASRINASDPPAVPPKK